jgi:uncharacterized coiled-coil protein SlyX
MKPRIEGLMPPSASQASLSAGTPLSTKPPSRTRIKKRPPQPSIRRRWTGRTSSCCLRSRPPPSSSRNETRFEAKEAVHTVINAEGKIAKHYEEKIAEFVAGKYPLEAKVSEQKTSAIQGLNETFIEKDGKIGQFVAEVEEIWIEFSEETAQEYDFENRLHRLETRMKAQFEALLEEVKNNLVAALNAKLTEKDVEIQQLNSGLEEIRAEIVRVDVEKVDRLEYHLAEVNEMMEDLFGCLCFILLHNENVTRLSSICKSSACFFASSDCAKGYQALQDLDGYKKIMGNSVIYDSTLEGKGVSAGAHEEHCITIVASLMEDCKVLPIICLRNGSIQMIRSVLREYAGNLGDNRQNDSVSSSDHPVPKSARLSPRECTPMLSPHSSPLRFATPSSSPFRPSPSPPPIPSPRALRTRSSVIKVPKTPPPTPLPRPVRKEPPNLSPIRSAKVSTSPSPRLVSRGNTPVPLLNSSPIRAARSSPSPSPSPPVVPSPPALRTRSKLTRIPQTLPPPSSSRPVRKKQAPGWTKLYDMSYWTGSGAYSSESE